MFNNIFQVKFSFKTIFLLSSIILFSCEDDAKDGPINGTFQLSKKSQDCDGYEEIEYMTINNTTITFIAYMNDACNTDNDSDAEDCYDAASETFPRDGDVLTGADGETITLSLSGKELTITIAWDGESDTVYYDHISDDIKTYTPICSWSEANY